MRLTQCTLAAVLSLSSLALTPLFGQTRKINKDQAKAIALKLHPGKVKSAELEKEHGVQLYSFDIQTKEGIREVGIDAGSGKVIEDSLESPADEAKEAAAEKSTKH
jgi:uncharacterized membrane protein YkoI